MYMAAVMALCGVVPVEVYLGTEHMIAVKTNAQSVLSASSPGYGRDKNTPADEKHLAFAARLWYSGLKEKLSEKEKRHERSSSDMQCPP